MREKILTFIEKNSRIDTQELAVILGVDETAVMKKSKKWRMRESSADIIR